MIKFKISLIFILLLIYGCSSTQSFDNATYINKKNGHKIEFLKSKKFIYTSYDGMQGVYYSYGDWEKRDKKVILINREIEPYIEIAKQSHDNTHLTIVDYRPNSNKERIEYIINNKTYKSSEIIIDEPIHSLIIKYEHENKILKEIELEKGFYKIEIKIAETLNEVSIDTLILEINSSFLIDNLGMKYKRIK